MSKYIANTRETIPMEILPGTELLRPGDIMYHFKGGIYEIITIATNTETKEKMMVYKNHDTEEVWVRPLDMFLSDVDHEKYPDVKQQKRFERIIYRDDGTPCVCGISLTEMDSKLDMDSELSEQ